jgi:hypothetical protein
MAGSADPHSGFHVENQMLYMKLAINEFYHGTSPALELEEVAHAAIIKLLQTVPLNPSQAKNRQDTSPNQKHGIIELPLWQHRGQIHPRSPHWAA